MELEQEEERQLIGIESASNLGSMVSASLGRVMTTLLHAKPKKLLDAILRLHSPPKIAPLAVTVVSAQVIGETAEKGEPLDQVLVPILQHSKQGNQSLILLNWLFQDEVLFQAIVRNMAAIILKRDDRYLALGWCFLGCSLIEYENVVGNASVNDCQFVMSTTNDGDENTLRKASDISSSLELKSLLWSNLSELITLVKKLTAWSRKSRALHAKGLERVFKWLQEIKQHYGCFQDEAESQMLTSGSLILSSCWKHYGMLLRLEDHKFSQQHKELLDQYLSGIEFYADNQAEEPSMSRNSKSETINFFLNCLLLLLGRLDNQQFGNAITEFGSQISQVLMSQLRCADEEVIDGTTSIFKAVILRTNHTLSTRSLGDIRQMDALLPILLNLLDERDAAAKAIVKLLAEYCSIKCLNEVLKRIDSKNVAQRRNAVDFVADLIHISSGSVNALTEAACKLSRNPDSGAPTGRKEGSTFDADRILKLLSEWAKHVEDWHVMVGPLIDKMLAEPSNAVIVRFLSHISEYLAEAVDVVFNRLIVHMREQKEIDECFPKLEGRTDTNSEAMKREHCLFSRLCPLLVIRLLPLRIFDDLNSPIVYGEYLRNSDVHDGLFSIEGTECIAALMINRFARQMKYFQVLIPNFSSQLESAASTKDVLTIKVCLFSFCTSLMVRGISVYMHPDLFRIKKTIRKVLSWPSVDGDETSKAQHGCIDCLALMLCTELQFPQSSKGTAISGGSVLAYVISQLTNDEEDIFSNLMEMIRWLRQLSASRFDFGMVEPEIRAACIQVLFAVAYHLKSSIFPYSNDLLSVALKSLKEGSQKNKIVGTNLSHDISIMRKWRAKLLTCLMASEEEVVESISDRLLPARTLLQDLSPTDPSPDVRLMCQQLLVCLTSH
ncbi:hypothetical protein DH2020_041613 [Rehmannia glutinosa]|uniref:ARM repeat superfamily protein n=1 Tax=Rehmannia glutinosa TaxID=99300 RepID=A0ABR0UQA5_REHGL